MCVIVKKSLITFFISKSYFHLWGDSFFISSKRMVPKLSYLHRRGVFQQITAGKLM
jgi:hypothetical protein